jgi:antibiotic biosynthesis monooxygenase (ABM) superfamily enzyme
VRTLMSLGKEWDDRERVRAKGYISTEILWDDREDGRGMMIVRFSSKDEYLRNANSPEQDAFFKRLRACLEQDPEWTDGEFHAWDTPFAKPPAWSEKTKS